MSSNKRPWYKWYPKDFNQDEKVKSLSPKAEIVYRRLLDVMWQANDCQLPSNCFKLANMVAWDLLDFASEKLEENFKKIWDEIQYPGFELFKTTEDGLWIYSKRLTSQLSEIQEKEKSFELLRKIRAESGRKGGKAKRKQVLSKKKANVKQMLSKRLQDTDTDTDTELKIYSPNSDEFRLSSLLFSLIKKRNPKHKKPNFQTWSKSINSIIRLDKRKPEEIRKIINWCQEDSFWQNNILSPEKLRKQFDKLWLKMNGMSQTENNNNSVSYQPPIEEQLS